MGAMTGAMRDALELIRSLKKQYPDETEDQLFQKELEADRALKRAVMREVFKRFCMERSLHLLAETFSRKAHAHAINTCTASRFQSPHHHRQPRSSQPLVGHCSCMCAASSQRCPRLAYCADRLARCLLFPCRRCSQSSLIQ